VLWFTNAVIQITAFINQNNFKNATAFFTGSAKAALNKAYSFFFFTSDLLKIFWNSLIHCTIQNSKIYSYIIYVEKIQIIYLLEIFWNSLIHNIFANCVTWKFGMYFHVQTYIPPNCSISKYISKFHNPKF